MNGQRHKATRSWLPGSRYSPATLSFGTAYNSGTSFKPSSVRIIICTVNTAFKIQTKQKYPNKLPSQNELITNDGDYNSNNNSNHHGLCEVTLYYTLMSLNSMQFSSLNSIKVYDTSKINNILSSRSIHW